MADSKAPSKPGSPKAASDPSTLWRFTGEYAAIYLPPDRVSRWIQPAEVVDWGSDGPPDGHWEQVDTPPAPSASDDTKKE